MHDEGREAARIEELKRYRILDTQADPAFDRITELAVALFSVPIALVSLVDENRQWFKSCVGLAAGETPRDVAFCAHAILKDDPLIIPDATADARFRDNPLVTGPPNIRFYAGAPLITPRGHRLGTMCVIDTAPRPFDPQEIHFLQTLSRTVIDLLELHARTNALAEARGEMHTILDSMDEIVVARDLARRPLIINRAAQEAFGGASETRDPGQWLMQTQVLLPDLSPFPPSELPIVRALAGETVRGSVMCLRAGEKLTFYSVHATPLRDEHERVIGGVAVGRNVTEERRLQELERQLARTDPLTGLCNRRALDDVAPPLLAGADRRGSLPVSVALFDLDHFKRINDTGGHDVGDSVLRAVSQVLLRQARATDVVVRWGGEELFALLPDCPLDGAKRFAERVRTEIEQLNVERAGPVTISAGVAERGRGENLDAVIGRADRRLYQAKREGRNRVVFSMPPSAEPSE